jgi:hypothetical protein
LSALFEIILSKNEYPTPKATLRNVRKLKYYTVTLFP